MLADERSAVEDSAAALDADTAAAGLSSAAAAAECVLEHPTSHITKTIILELVMHMVSDTEGAFWAITCSIQVFGPLSLSCTLFF